MRHSWVKNFPGSLNEFGRSLSRNIDRHNLVVLTMHDQCRHIELLEIIVEVGLGKCLDTFVEVLEAAPHTPQPELIQHPLRDFCPRTIGAIEGDGEVLPELRGVLSE